MVDLAGHGAGIDQHENFIFRAGFDALGDVQLERRESAFVAAHALAVDPDLRVAIDRVGAELDAFAGPIGRHVEGFSINRLARLGGESFHGPMGGNLDGVPGEALLIGREIFRRIDGEIPRPIQRNLIFSALHGSRRQPGGDVAAVELLLGAVIVFRDRDFDRSGRGERQRDFKVAVGAGLRGLFPRAVRRFARDRHFRIADDDASIDSRNRAHEPSAEVAGHDDLRLGISAANRAATAGSL